MQYFQVSIPQIMTSFRSATECDTNWYKAWHAWAFINYQVYLVHHLFLFFYHLIHPLSTLLTQSLGGRTLFAPLYAARNLVALHCTSSAWFLPIYCPFACTSKPTRYSATAHALVQIWSLEGRGGCSVGGFPDRQY